ncbi:MULTISPECIES: siderophore-interacting protein [unclassified Agarivorans]|uniref:siderophore-interacting protein n=1 Tax=unclassified Agarivorans TaxID=2636026 RepID=UPI003D7E7C67
MKRKLQLKQLTVVKSETISPNMQRVTLSGEAIKSFAEDSAGQYLKLLFHPQGGSDLSSLSEEQRPVVRTYTVQALDQSTQTLSIDFVRHGDAQPSPENGGYANHWAQHCKVGDSIQLAGPNSNAAIDMNTDSVLLIADMTALPAMQAKLAQLPSNTQGTAFVLLKHQADKQSIQTPEGIQIHWLIEEDNRQTLADVVINHPWPQGSVAVWCACEFTDMRKIRAYISQLKVPRSNSYFSSYWKQGMTEDGHKVLKKEDSDAFSHNMK